MAGPDLSAWAQPAAPQPPAGPGRPRTTTDLVRASMGLQQEASAPDLSAFAQPARSNAQRFGENVVDAFNRNPTIASVRRALTDPLSGLPGTLRPGLLNKTPSAFDMLGPLGYPTETATNLAGSVLRTIQPGLIDNLATDERKRRQGYEARSAADPWFQAPGGKVAKAIAGASTLGGQVVGGATDPINLYSPGKTLATRALGAAGVNALGDVVTQAADMGSGIQDAYSPTQTAAATALGPVLSVAGDLAGPAARGVSDLAKRGAAKVRGAMPDLSAFARAAERAPEAPTAGPRPPAEAQAPDLSGFGSTGPETAAPFDVPTKPAAPAVPASAAPIGRDWTGEALDVIRSGKRVRVEQGPSLAEFIAKQGGLADDGGELRNLDANLWHRERVARPKLVRDAGLSLEEAAGRARDAGYFDDLAPASMEGGSNTQIGGEVVLDALRRELAGEPRYSRQPDPDTADLARHVDDLDELLSVAGIDPKRGSPAEIRKAIDDFLRAPDPNRAFASPLASNGKVDGSWKAATAAESFKRGDHPGATWLAEDVDAPKVGPLADRIASGERQAFTRSVGPGGRATYVTQRSLADLLPPDHVGPVFHETDIKGATGILNRTLQGFRRHDRIFVSPSRDLALGQKGRGVVLEFDPAMVNGFKPQSLANDATGAVFGNAAELAIDKTLKPAVRAITTKTAAQLEKLRATPWIASRFDFDNARPVDKGFRIERKAPAPSSDRLGMRVTPDEAAPDLTALQSRLRERLQSEPVRLADGMAEQTLIPGVEPVSPEVSPTVRARARGETLPPGGLFDEQARAQGDMFDKPPGKLAAIDLSSYGEAAPSASRGSGLRDAPKPGAIPRAAGAEAKHLASVSTLADRLKQSLGLSHRQGRLTLKKAAGEYDPHSGIIRTRVVHEIDVLAHEGGHALEYKAGHPTFKAALKAHEGELRKLAYPGADPRHMREEGFAEWFRWYVTNPTKAASAAPGFHAAFEAALSRDNPAMLRDLGGIRSAYQDLLQSSSVDVARSAVVWPAREGMTSDIAKAVKLQGVLATVRDLADDAYSATFDRLNPIKVAVRKLLKVAEANQGQRLDLKTAADPYKLSRLAVEPYSAGQMDVLHGVTPYKGVDPEGPSLAQAVGKALGKDWTNDRLEEFGTYLVARRMLQEWKRRDAGELKRDPHSLPAEVWKTVRADLEATNPTWSEAASSVHEWTTNLWRKQYEAGLIGQKTYDEGRAMPDYVPLMRDLSDKMRGPAGVKGDAQFAGGVKEFKGSTRDIINPLRALMERAQRVSAIINRNEIFKALDDLGQRAGEGGGAIVERIPASEAAAVHVNVVEALEKAAKDAGLSPADYTDLVDEAAKMLDGNEIVPLFQAGVINTKGEPILFMWRKGRREAVRLADGKFGRDLYTVLAGLEDDPRSLVVDIMAKPTQILRAGVTLSPDFMAANYIRDQVSASILSDVGFKPFLSGARGLVDELSQSDFARRYYASGGMRGGANTASLTKARVTADLREFRGKGHAIRRLTTWRGLTELTELSERSTRIGVFRLAYQKAKRGGLSDFEAIKEAAYEARDLMDFDRYGSRMLAARRVVTFLNAGLQGLDKLRRVLTADSDWQALAQPWSKVLTGRNRRAAFHAYKAMAMMAGLGMLGAQLSAIYKDDPEYQELSDYLRATHWMFKAPGGEWISVPKPFELAVFSNIAERAVESKSDPTAWERMAKGLGEILIPPHEIPLVTVPYQIAANRDYNGRPIVPDQLRGTVDPDQQFTSYTSELAKFIGHQIKVAPAVVDHVITGIGGTAGRYVTQAADRFAFGKAPQAESGPEDRVLVRRFVRDETRGSTSQAKFWELVSKDGGKFTQAEGTFRAHIKSADDPKAIGYLNKMDPAARAYVMSQVFSQSGSAKLHPLTRAQAELSVVGELRRDLREPTLQSFRGDDIALTPEIRRKADDALSTLAMADMRNALIETGAKGWEGKAPIPREAALDDLAEVDPALASELQARLLLDKVPTPEQSAAFWGAIRDRFEAPADSSTMEGLMSAKRSASGDLLSKLRERNRLAAPAMAGR